jgi:high affinity Mn2+ porin
MRKGIVRALAFRNIANAGIYRNAVRLALPLLPPDITQTRIYGTSKYGFVLGVEQELSSNLGLFARASWNDGTSETWAFTEIDHSACVGVQIDGNLWQRNDDVLGIASVVNGISDDHRQYLMAGGYGFIIGDGALRYAPEWVSEIYYRFQLNDWCSISADYQCVVNPAYNQDRGPIVHIGAVRVHIEF